MKKLSLSILAALLFTVGVSAQASKAVGGPEAEKYDLGGQIVRVPTPAAFTNVFLRDAETAAKFKAAETPDDELLALYVADDDLERVSKGEQNAFVVYIKLSIRRKAKALDITPQQFASLAKMMDDQFTTQIDPLKWKSMVQTSKDRQNKAAGTDITLEVTTPQSLGNFEHGSATNSILMLMTVNTGGVTQPMLCATSLLHVKNRVIQIYAYHPARAEDDPDKLRQFAKSWNAAIIAANK